MDITRAVLIVTGTLLAAGSLIIGVRFGGSYALLAACGTLTAIQTLGLINERGPDK